MIFICLLKLLQSLISISHGAEFAEFGTLNTTLPSSGGLGVGVGLGTTLGIDIFEPISLEIGLIYMGRGFSYGISSTYQVRMVQIPVLIRYEWNPQFSIGGGIYHAYTVGNISVSRPASSDIVGNNMVGWGTTDFGFVSSVRYKKPLHEVINLVADGRILFGTSNFSLSDQRSLYFRDLQILFGIAFAL